MKNLLYFYWEDGFCDPIEVVANNEQDLSSYLEREYDFTIVNIDLDEGICNVQYKSLWTETATIKYVPKI